MANAQDVMNPWTTCSCGHIAQAHNKRDPTIPSTEHTSADWGCDHCDCVSCTSVKKPYCITCGQRNVIMTIHARAKDQHSYTMPDGTMREGYAIWFSADGDMTEITLCTHCGQIQDKFPLDLTITEEESD